MKTASHIEAVITPVIMNEKRAYVDDGDRPPHASPVLDLREGLSCQHRPELHAAVETAETGAVVDMLVCHESLQWVHGL